MPTLSDVDILLVEDNPRDAEMALRALRRHGLTSAVVHVQDGKDALDWIFGAGDFTHRNPSLHPKVVLLDLKLPKIPGLEVLRAIREDTRTRLMPVVVVTSSREDRDVVESYRLYANSYVVKPVDFDDYVTTLNELGHYWLRLNERPH